MTLKQIARAMFWMAQGIVPMRQLEFWRAEGLDKNRARWEALAAADLAAAEARAEAEEEIEVWE